MARKYSPEYYRQNRERILASSRKWRLKNLGYAKERSYGFTQEEYEEMLEEQEYKCPICEVELYVEGWLENNAPTVDHDHKTGKIRGILCRKCNRGIGLLGDNLNNMQNAIIYLKKGDN